jgi:hypothetical protein
MEDIVTQKKTEGTFSYMKSFEPTLNATNTEHQGISSLKQNCTLITDPILKVNVMNDQFKSVFSNANKITDSEFAYNCKLPMDSNYQTIPSHAKI